MVPTNPKSGRSRFSSPAHLSSSPSGHNRGLGTEGQRSFIQRWLEPPVQNKASFQEAGLMRAGVVENMAPLGTLPKAAAMKKPTPTAEGTPAPGVKRIVFKKSAPKTTPVEETTPQPFASTGDSPVRESAEIGLSSPSRPVFPAAGLEEDDDDDYMPQKNASSKSRRSSRANSRPVRSGRRSLTTTRQKSPASQIHTPLQLPPQQPEQPQHQTANPAREESTPAPTSATTALTFEPPASTIGREPENKEFVDKAVESAVEEALRHSRYPTAWALRLLYDENSSDSRFVCMIEDVFHQRADIETLQEFTRLVQARKKEGKEGNKGFYYYEPTDDSIVSRTTPYKPKPAPYAKLLTMDLTPIKDKNDDSDRHVSKKLKVEGNHMITGGGGGGASSTSSSSSGGGMMNGTNGTHGVNGRRGPSGSSHHKSPSKNRKHRSGSVSSDSSLSSVPDDAIDDFPEFMGSVADDDVGVSRPSTAEPNNAPAPVGSTRPISGHHKKPASKKKNVSPDPAAPSTNTTTQSSLPHTLDMPAAIVATNGASSSHIHNGRPLARSKASAKSAEPAASDGLDDNDFTVQKREKRQEVVDLTKSQSLPSFSRRPLEADSRGEPAPAAVAPAEQSRSIRTPAPLSLRAARAAKRKNDDVDESISPTTAASVRADLDLPSSTQHSRAATPSNLRSNNKQRAGLRVKNSPMKKKGTSAGIPRGSGERPSPVGNGASNDKDDNDDSCYTCGGNGELVCCDGCHYSFHFLCIDPPMDDVQMPDDWFCNECMHRYYPAHFTGHRGAFGSLLDGLDKKNPRAFRLPQDIREYFEGVRTGPDGEYEEDTPAKPKPNKKGYDEPFDFFKVRSAEGNAVLCHHCHQGSGSTDNRPVIPCSACGLNWHLECLDPPLTIPPVLRTWRCPCHVQDVFMGSLSPAHKYRKIKGAPVIEQAYSRGMANNGYIEIEEDDDDEPEDAALERRNFGRVYRLSERGIKLDFVAAVKRNSKASASRRTKKNARALERSRNPALKPVPRMHLRTSLEEQQAALNLCQFSLSSDDGIDQVVEAVLTQAPPAAISLIARGDAANIASRNLSDADANSLRAMLAQVEAYRDGLAKALEARESNSSGQGDTPSRAESGSATCLSASNTAAATSAGDQKPPPTGADGLGDSTMQID